MFRLDANLAFCAAREQLIVGAADNFYRRHGSGAGAKNFQCRATQCRSRELYGWSRAFADLHESRSSGMRYGKVAARDCREQSFRGLAPQIINDDVDSLLADCESESFRQVFLRIAKRHELIGAKRAQSFERLRVAAR